MTEFWNRVAFAGGIIVGMAVLMTLILWGTERFVDWSFRRKLGPKYRLDKCDYCGKKRLLGLVEKTGYEGWFCADCQDPPLECTCYEAVPGHMVGCPAKKR